MANSIFITTSNIGYGTGGGAVCYNICQSLKNTTNLTSILASCNAFPSNLQVPCTETQPGYYKQPSNPFLFDYFAYWNLPNEHIDIAHFYGAPFGITAREIKKRNPRSTILIDIPAHNLELSIQEHQMGIGVYPYIHMVDPFLWEVFSEHIRLADIIISPSKTSLRYLRESETFHKILKYRQKDIPMIHIPHGTNIPPVEEIKPFPEKFSVATLSQCGWDKGQIYLLTAWKALENIFPNYTCNVAGYNTENWKPFVEKNNIKNITLGAVDNAADAYNNCTVYVHPSVTEGWGITVIEAMSYGRPVVVTNETGACEVVEDGKNGFVIPIRDPTIIAEKIRWLHDNPEECKRMGQEARKTAEKYSWDDMRKKYEETYNMIP